MQAPAAANRMPQPSLPAETSKAINHLELDHGHAGVAEPLTWHQLENEMSFVDQNIRDSSTSKDGISTWILLSGSEKQQPSPTPASTIIVGQVDKIEVKEPSTDRHNYRFEEIHQDKIVKPNKTHRHQPEKKSKPTILLATTTTAATTTKKSGILQATDFASETKIVQRRKNPLNRQNKRKVTIATTSSISTTNETPIFTTNKMEEETNIELKMDDKELAPAPITTTPIPLIVLEPKDAEFDIPQDRSPATKNPKRTTTKIKRKNPIKSNKGQTVVSKLPINKLKEKPISTKIYNYLSREVMPTVGVGIMGLVVTAGLASYFFGPLTALRRSYEDALDRQDNVDNIYSINSEEYASDSTDNGQNEEEIFGKFIAGMPANNVPKYVKYFKPEQQTPYHNNHQYNPNIAQRRIYAQAQQHTGPKYNPYIRYRTDGTFPKLAPSPHFSPTQYHPDVAALRNHQLQAQQPQQQLSPVYDPQYHEMQKQKSFTNSMDSILKQQAPVFDTAQTVQEKSTGSEILAEEFAKTEEHTIKTEPDEMNSQMQRRTNTFVVGSAISDIRPDETIVSASMTAASSNDMLPSNVVEPVVTVTAATHGPRRRRRSTLGNKPAQPQQTKPTSEKYNEGARNIVANITDTSKTQLLYDQNDVKLLEDEFNRLKEKKIALNKNDSNLEIENKIKIKLKLEFKNIEMDFVALKQGIVAVQDIETFQKQLKIRAKNYELSVTLKTGIAKIRQRIKLMDELIEHPEDDRIIQKINRRDGNETNMKEPSTDNSHVETEDTKTDTGLIGFLKLLQLKAQFGLNLLKTIQPSFERAFEEVFKRPIQNN